MPRWIVLALLALSTGMGTLGETTVAVEDMPAAARAALESQAQGRPILAVTARAGPGSDTVYEALVAGDQADVDVAVDQRGRIVARFILPRATGIDGNGTLR
jgi:hypothetical protein